jgi:hypothetical protein
VKLLITLEVEVDEGAWDATYGVSAGAEQVADVESYVVGQVAQSAAAEEGAITSAVQVHVTKTGKVLRDADFERLADEAERGA